MSWRGEEHVQCEQRGPLRTVLPGKACWFYLDSVGTSLEFHGTPVLSAVERGNRGVEEAREQKTLQTASQNAV